MAGGIDRDREISIFYALGFPISRQVVRGCVLSHHIFGQLWPKPSNRRFPGCLLNRRQIEKRRRNILLSIRTGCLGKLSGRTPSSVGFNTKCSSKIISSVRFLSRALTSSDLPIPKWVGVISSVLNGRDERVFAFTFCPSLAFQNFSDLVVSHLSRSFPSARKRGSAKYHISRFVALISAGFPFLSMVLQTYVMQHEFYGFNARVSTQSENLTHAFGVYGFLYLPFPLSSLLLDTLKDSPSGHLQ